MTTVSIHSTDQLGEVVREASSQNRPIYPVSGQTQQHLLAPARDDGIRVHLQGLNQVIDYPHQDLTITVQAGMTLQMLHQLLAQHQQTLPIDVPQSTQATVGGSIAANINGPRRTGWGTWRDYLIGLSWINDQGNTAKAGGRVVKNVAGYDFCKLFTGSFGTLGIITQVTLKMKPCSEKQTLVRTMVKKEALGQLCELIRYSRLRPTLFLVQPDQQSSWPVYYGFEDSAAAVDWQVDHLRDTLRTKFSEACTIEAVISATDAEKNINELTQFAVAGESVSFQANLPSSRCAEFISQAQPLVPMLQVQPAAGLVTGHLPPDVTSDDADRIVANLRSLAATMSGHLTVTRCPASWRSSLVPFGPARPEWELMRKVKRAMDPSNIFQRGRFEVVEDGSQIGGK